MRYVCVFVCVYARACVPAFAVSLCVSVSVGIVISIGVGVNCSIALLNVPLLLLPAASSSHIHFLVLLLLKIPIPFASLFVCSLEASVICQTHCLCAHCERVHVCVWVYICIYPLIQKTKKNFPVLSALHLRCAALSCAADRYNMLGRSSLSALCRRSLARLRLSQRFVSQSAHFAVAVAVSVAVLVFQSMADFVRGER